MSGILDADVTDRVLSKICEDCEAHRGFSACNSDKGGCALDVLTRLAKRGG